MQKNSQPRLGRSPQVRRRLGQLERLEQRRLMAVLPEAVNDLYQVSIDQPLDVSGPGVLANDTAAAGGALAAQLFSGPTHGTLELAEDGSFLYTPSAGYVGLDSFMYWASEGDAASLLAAVTVRVSADGGGPVTQSDSYAVNEDDSLNVTATAGVWDNDAAMAGGVLTAAVVDGPANGTLSLGEDGAFTYTPNDNFHGADSFTYIASEGSSSSAPTTVSITVRPRNDKPVAANDAFAMQEDESLVVDTGSVLGNDSDLDGDALVVELVSEPLHGSVTLNADGTFTYTPDANFNGIDGFSYLATDGIVDSQVATVTITVGAVNDAPLAGDDTYTLDEDTPLDVPAATGLLLNDSDLDGDTLTPVVVTGPQHGALTLNADGSFTYAPSANFSGVDTFTYVVNDGTTDSAVATVTLNVIDTNDTPIANNDEYTLDEDNVLLIEAAGGVLTNDVDGDGDALLASLVSGPQHGALTLNADGSFSYTPAANFHGVDGFSYMTNDGTTDSAVATVTINVTPGPDAPLANNDEYTLDEDGALTVEGPGVLSNDTDADGDTLTASLVSDPQHGALTLNADGSFTYTPDADFSGVDGFSYVVNDGTADSAVATVTLNVNPTPDAPVASDDAYTIDEDGELVVAADGGLLANDTDTDGDALTPTVVTGPEHGELTLNADGSFSYTPAADFHGTDSFTYTVHDGTLTSAAATVTLTIQPVNDAPSAAADNYVVNEDSVLQIAGPGVLANDTDPEADPLTALLVTGPEHGDLVLNEDGSFTYTPDANYHGTDGFTYKTSDGALESQEVAVTIVVNPTPDAPRANHDSFSGGEDSVLSGTVFANDFDPEGLPLTAELVTGPQHGALELNADGTFTYTPAANYFGTDSFTYLAKNGVEDSLVTTATLTIEPLNDAPVAVAQEFEVAAGETLVVSAGDSLLPGGSGLLAGATDIENDPLTARLLYDPQHGALVMSDDGSFTYTPDDGFVGEDRFYMQAHDGSADSNVVEVVIYVGQPDTGGEENSAPVGSADNYVVAAGQTLSIDAPGVLANDSDADGDALTAMPTSDPEHGSLSLAADGSLTYTPDAGFVGEDSFTYAAHDGEGSSAPVTVTITVNDISTENVAPVSADDQFETNVGTVLNIPAAGVLGNDSDANGDALSALVIDGPSHGTLALAADGSFAYTPDAGYNGADSFTYQASDGALAGNTATVNITIATTENTRPNAVNEQYQTSAETPLVIAAAGVLANDSDAQGDALTAYLFSGPQHGVATLAADGSFAYTPAVGYVGVDSFIYRVFDGQRYSALAAVTIRVNGATPASLGVSDIALAAVAAGQSDEGAWLSETIDALFGSADPLA